MAARKGEGDREVSFIDAEVKKWLETEAPETGLCLKRFHADFTVEGLVEVTPGQSLVAEGCTFEITLTGKRCFEECELLRETGHKCLLASGVAFGRRITDES